MITATELPKKLINKDTVKQKIITMKRVENKFHQHNLTEIKQINNILNISLSTT